MVYYRRRRRRFYRRRSRYPTYRQVRRLVYSANPVNDKYAWLDSTPASLVWNTPVFIYAGGINQGSSVGARAGPVIYVKKSEITVHIYATSTTPNVSCPRIRIMAVAANDDLGIYNIIQSMAHCNAPYVNKDQSSSSFVPFRVLRNEEFDFPLKSTEYNKTTRTFVFRDWTQHFNTTSYSGVSDYRIYIIMFKLYKDEYIPAADPGDIVWHHNSNHHFIDKP